MAGKRRLPRAAGGANAANKKRRYDERAPLSSSPLYAASDDVLVLGDGGMSAQQHCQNAALLVPHAALLALPIDFSFSQGLASHRGTGAGVVATSFDSESRVKSKYPNAAECIAAVRRAGGLVLHSVDATKLHLLPRSAPAGEGKQQQKTKKKAVPAFFQYIVFNFPHSGQQRVHINRALLLDFFESARARLLARGEAHVTLKTRPPYSNWLVEDQAKAAGFVLKERRKFDARLFPGYRHRTTDPQAKKFEAELCVTYTFVVNRSKVHIYVGWSMRTTDVDSAADSACVCASCAL